MRSSDLRENACLMNGVVKEHLPIETTPVRQLSGTTGPVVTARAARAGQRSLRSNTLIELGRSLSVVHRAPVDDASAAAGLR